MKQKKKRLLCFHDVSSSTIVETAKIEQKFEEYGEFKLDDVVYYNISLVKVVYSTGILKEITFQKEKIVFCVWDIEKKMWRNILAEKVFKVKPPKQRKKMSKRA